jgi:hypothetical protein
MSIVRFYGLTHERLLKITEDLSAAQFVWSAGPSLHSAAWQLWHSARWDDFFAAHLQTDFDREPRTEVWQRESLAERWSLAPGSLGRRDAGTGMDDASAEKMKFPDKDAVMDYSRQAFAFALSAISAIPGEQMTNVAKADPDGDTYLDNILIYFEHLSRHLGMIEAIRGLQGLSGSATR